MSDRTDWLKSFVRSAVDRVGETVREQPAWTAIKTAARDLRARSAAIPDRTFARVALRLPGVVSSSVAATDGAVRFEAELEDGRWCRALIHPEAGRFAARGAKELVFRIEPPEAANEIVVRELVGSIAAWVARTIWSAALGVPGEARDGDEGAFVERDGATLHVDLRTVPSVRKALARGGATVALIEAIRVERLEARDGAVHVVLGLPAMP